MNEYVVFPCYFAYLKIFSMQGLCKPKDRQTKVTSPLNSGSLQVGGGVFLNHLKLLRVTLSYFKLL